jgi:hypothetical protein
MDTVPWWISGRYLEACNCEAIFAQAVTVARV